MFIGWVYPYLIKRTSEWLLIGMVYLGLPQKDTTQIKHAVAITSASAAASTCCLAVASVGLSF
jgi:hypothetical protein